MKISDMFRILQSMHAELGDIDVVTITEVDKQAIVDFDRSLEVAEIPVDPKNPMGETKLAAAFVLRAKPFGPLRIIK